MTTKMMVTLGLVLSIAWIPIVGTILALQHHGVASLARRAIDALARDRRLQFLALFGYFLVLMAVTVAYGIRHDYVTYALLWDNTLAGGDLLSEGSGTPLKDTIAAQYHNNYGPLFNAFAALYFLHPLLPKVMFSGLFFASVVLIMKRVLEPDLRCPVRFAIVLCVLPFNPYFWIFVPGYGILDTVPAVLSLAAVLCRVRRRLWLSGLLLGCGFLVKVYPLILLPFLMYERRRLLWTPALAFAGLAAAGMGVSFPCVGGVDLEPNPLCTGPAASNALDLPRDLGAPGDFPRAVRDSRCRLGQHLSHGPCRRNGVGGRRLAESAGGRCLDVGLSGGRHELQGREPELHDDRHAFGRLFGGIDEPGQSPHVSPAVRRPHLSLVPGELSVALFLYQVAGAALERGPRIHWSAGVRPGVDSRDDGTAVHGSRPG